MKEHNEIDLLFQSTFDGLELPLDPTMKENIDRAIAAKKKRRRFLFILFPVLFGTTGFAATLYFYPFSERTSPNQELALQNRLSEDATFSAKTQKDVVRIPKSKQITSYDSILEEINSTQKKPLARTSFKRNNPSLISQSIELHKSKSTLRIIKKPVSYEEQTLLTTEKKTQKLQLNKSPENQEIKTRLKQDTVTIAENKLDSTAIQLLVFTDSILNQLAASTKYMAANQAPKKWSLSILSYWEGEKKRNSNFEDNPYIENKKENARIHSSTFYGKIEVNRKLTPQLEMLTGIGFRSSKVVQYGYLNEIKYSMGESISGVPQPIIGIDTVFSTQTQSFQINSVILPIGLAYSIPLIKNTQMRLSGGAEFAYGKISSQYIQFDLSAPKFHSFGVNFWLRPEIHYTFGKFQLFGFGSFNQAISQQLRWDFKVRRNPAFGAGIGVLINL
jgi:hypothetical protein